MDTKGIVIILAIIVLVAGGIWYFGAEYGKTPMPSTTTTATPPATAPAATPPATP
jgi:hypothetical protein